MALAKGHTWSLFSFFAFFGRAGGKTPLPHEIWNHFRSSRQPAARLVLAPALASTAVRGPTHRLRTNGIGYP